MGVGYGHKLTYKTSKEDEDVPGPVYKAEYYNSLQAKIDKLETKKDSTFGCDKE